jgi:myotubularin-related protein 1/2
MGGGYENTVYYPNTEFEFLNIHNIHVMRESLARLQQLMRSALHAVPGWTSKYYSELEATGWMEHLRLILEGTAKIVNIIENKKCSVFIHCSDGWDRYVMFFI